MYNSVFALLLPLAISSPVQHESVQYLDNEVSDTVPLVTFDGAEGTTYKFHVLNDPVMVRTLHLMVYRLIYDNNRCLFHTIKLIKFTLFSGWRVNRHFRS